LDLSMDSDFHVKIASAPQFLIQFVELISKHFQMLVWHFVLVYLCFIVDHVDSHQRRFKI
jgi:hypothetical protein